MLDIFLGMGICIIVYVVAFAFARAAARADARREHDVAPSRPSADTYSPAIAPNLASTAPHNGVESSDNRGSSTTERNDVIF